MSREAQGFELSNRRSTWVLGTSGLRGKKEAAGSRTDRQEQTKRHIWPRCCRPGGLPGLGIIAARLLLQDTELLPSSHTFTGSTSPHWPRPAPLSQRA